jgi:hypothetical protein
LICSRILKKDVFFISWLWNLNNSHNFVTLFSYLFIFRLPLFKRGFEWTSKIFSFYLEL